ncbi:MAG TPA: response regulator transcription factor [Terriglobales bacterium]|nr:response regulator transcription factor [Terriglobales bacterium]
MQTRILIVDDSPLVRQRLRDLLQKHVDWIVCGEAANGVDALKKVQELHPGLIVMDFLMPGMNGVQAAREISKLVPDIPIFMLTMHMSHQLEEEARRAGIQGALAKTQVSRVVEGLEAVLRHESYFPNEKP